MIRANRRAAALEASKSLHSRSSSNQGAYAPRSPAHLEIDRSQAESLTYLRAFDVRVFVHRDGGFFAGGAVLLEEDQVGEGLVVEIALRGEPLAAAFRPFDRAGDGGRPDLQADLDPLGDLDVITGLERFEGNQCGSAGHWLIRRTRGLTPPARQEMSLTRHSKSEKIPDPKSLHLFRLDPGHHAAELFADDFDGMASFAAADRLERRLVGLVLEDPFLGELPFADFLEDLLHLGLRLVGDDPRAASVVAELGRVRDAVPHVVEAPLI